MAINKKTTLSIMAILLHWAFFTSAAFFKAMLGAIMLNSIIPQISKKVDCLIHISLQKIFF